MNKYDQELRAAREDAFWCATWSVAGYVAESAVHYTRDSTWRAARCVRGVANNGKEELQAQIELTLGIIE